MKHKIKLFLRWVIILFAIILGYSLVRSIVKIAGSEGEVNSVHERVEELKKENLALNDELKKVGSLQFIEQEARDKLGLAKKGEIVAVLPDTNLLRSLAPKEDEKTYSLPDPIWMRWWRLFE